MHRERVGAAVQGVLASGPEGAARVGWRRYLRVPRRRQVQVPVPLLHGVRYRGRGEQRPGVGMGVGLRYRDRWADPAGLPVAGGQWADRPAIGMVASRYGWTRLPLRAYSDQ
jgi:hypothetical protein